jgi:hypothetical protein
MEGIDRSAEESEDEDDDEVALAAMPPRLPAPVVEGAGAAVVDDAGATVGGASIVRSGRKSPLEMANSTSSTLRCDGACRENSHARKSGT